MHGDVADFKAAKPAVSAGWSVALLEADARDQEKLVAVALNAELGELGSDREVFPDGKEHAFAQGGQLRRGDFHTVPADGRLNSLPGDLPRVSAAVATIFAQQIKHERKPCG
jgi:hypothetical protein